MLIPAGDAGRKGSILHDSGCLQCGSIPVSKHALIVQPGSAAKNRVDGAEQPTRSGERKDFPDVESVRLFAPAVCAADHICALAHRMFCGDGDNRNDGGQRSQRGSNFVPTKFSTNKADRAHSQMSQASSEMRNLARRLIAHEARQKKLSGTNNTATFPVWEKLRPPLASLVGSTGAGALLSRSLALASPEVAWLRAVHVKPDGSLEALDEIKTRVGVEQLAEGRIALVARLLGLLDALIGENLTRQLVREVWPNLFIGEFQSGQSSGIVSGDLHEIEK